MSGRRVATGLAAGRVAAGAAMLVAPRRVAGIWVGSQARTRVAPLMVRCVGARDVVLGAGVLRASRRADRSAVPWLWAGAVADAVDGVVGATQLDTLTVTGRATVAVAMTAAVVGTVLARHLGR